MNALRFRLLGAGLLQAVRFVLGMLCSGASTTVGVQQAPTAAARTEPSLTVVICAYTLARWWQLLDAVRSVQLQHYPADEILLVVDHCPELARRAERALPGVRVLPNAEAQGLSGGRNTGVAAAHGDIVAFLDDDAAADPDWTARLLTAYHDPRVLGVGGLVRPLWETGRPAWFPREFDWVVGCSYQGLPERRAPVRNFIGANMSFRRAEVLAAGGFRTDLGRIGTRPLGCEETELCLRVAARNPGGKLLYEPAAAVRHHVPAARTTRAYFRARCYAEGLSKAAVARHAGAGPALASERTYLRHTLPAAVADGLRPGGEAPPRTVPALVSGVTATVLGYAVGRLRRPVERTRGQAALRALAVLALPAALLLWLCTLLRGVDLGAMGDLGLVQVLPVTYWTGLVLLALGFCAALADRHSRTWQYTGYVLALITFLHATPLALYPELRYSWAWKHVAVTDVLLDTGTLPTAAGRLAVYAHWPGFFWLNDLFVTHIGLTSPGSYASWFPLLINAALVVPLLMLYRTFSRSRRLIWGGAFLFFSCSWVGQDYFSPQAFAFLLYVCVIAAVAHRLPRPGRPRPGRPSLGWAVLVLLAIATIVVSHPLTPVMLIGSLLLLSLPRRNRRVVLPVALVALALATAWDATAARPFIEANLHDLIGGLTTPESNAGSGLLGLSGATSGQVMVAWADRILSAVVFLFAGLAVLVRPSLRRTALPWLAVAPLPWAVANSYGGEMIFRVYLFALPATAFGAAALLLPPLLTPSRGRGLRRALRRVRAAAVPLVLVALFGALSLAYFGKENVNYFTASETSAAKWLATHAPEGSLIVGASDNFPYAYHDYEYHDRIWLSEAAPGDQWQVRRDPAAELHVLTGSGPPRPAYLILNRAQEAQVTATGALPPGTLAHLRSALAHRSDYPVIHRTADAVVYRILPERTPGGS
ncbi:glycosyltransferase [Streptomyces endophytica]|uniref:Glycosyltransferase n=1 Tax=Streptomyces endophytica TaxID=2991496 RepID=A0ABY6PFK6_9ACTN|nr:glycosyltransferase [Streptomyces endophytica]UZJ32653.1 glycosyltransferase [Streptomyces endophytica]